MIRTMAVALAAFWLVSFGVLAQGSTTSDTSSGTSSTTKSDTKKASKKKSKKAKKAAQKSEPSSQETPGGGARSGETTK